MKYQATGAIDARAFSFYEVGMGSLNWDHGTGYDLFASLYVLHHPGTFGVRGSWAAGVRSRLPASAREFLETAFSFLPVPAAWINGLPRGEKSAESVIAALTALPSVERLKALMSQNDYSIEAAPIWNRVWSKGRCSEADLNAMRSVFRKYRIANWPGMFQAMGKAWARPDVFGEQLLLALQAYYQTFFREEETRIQPVLQASLAESINLSQKIPFDELVETVSHGVHFDSTNSELILIPSFWAGPLVFFTHTVGGQILILYGGRPASMPLIPGEQVPTGMLNALKALSDPTRLRILRYLSARSRTLTELSRLLRLRPPTILHHLYALRQAELIEVSFQENNERRYALRKTGLADTMHALERFLGDEAHE